ncbi:MAG: hypothetical protein WC623_15380 [Pedobacter sp.]|uniref:TRAFAC clade GTPase domain-containing protein n=1 Tax=Pedobacter sp. TaxID=1411316 RepID=UPI0035632B91
MNKSLLLIGKPHASKTVFLSQFYSRLRKNKSKLSLYKPVEDLSPIAAVRDALSNGEQPETTPPERNVKFNIPIRRGNEHIDFLCPEYGGEQVNQIIENREVNAEWESAIKNSYHWILFIRIGSVSKSLDISEVTVEEKTIAAPPDQERPKHVLSEQSSYIELLQILLHYKNHDYHLLNRAVTLTVALTCWDELETKELPGKLLQERMPLVKSFLESNWDKSKLNIVGLSAQGFSLQDRENQEKYQIEGPEKFGYLIFADGQDTDDITELIDIALQ